MAIIPPEDPDEEVKMRYSWASQKINLKEAYEEVVSRVFENKVAVIVLDKFFEQQVVTPAVATLAKKE